LHPRNQGGSADNIQRTIEESDLPVLGTLRGRSVKGPWRLTVQDLAPADVGTLNRWALEFTTAGPAQEKVVLEEAPGTHIPDNRPAGIERALATTAAGNAGPVEVSVDVSHPYIGDLRVSLHSPAGTEVILHDRTGGSGDNIVKTYTTATTPALGTLAGQPIAGTWRLRVSDRAGQDVGKLNSWRVVIQPPV
jgi:subtilisin-like proprotein convertase family protein